MKVSTILSSKGMNVYSVNSNVTVYDALKVMGEKNIGAILVIDNDNLVGILSERDYARKIILKGKASHDTLVREIMTENPVTVIADNTIDHCMQLMSEKRIRHLPVVDGDKVTGMVSVSDVVTYIIQSQKETIDHLQNYIAQ